MGRKTAARRAVARDWGRFVRHWAGQSAIAAVLLAVGYWLFLKVLAWGLSLLFGRMTIPW